jgi:hypothetical protein
LPYRSPSCLIIAVSKKSKRFSGGKASLMQACGLGIRTASQSQRRSQELACCACSRTIIALELSACSETITRPPIRYVAQLPLANSSPIAVPRARLRTFHRSNNSLETINSDNTRNDCSHHGPLTHRLVSQSALSPWRLCSLACLCSPFLADDYRRIYAESVFLGRSHVSPRAYGWTLVHQRPQL